LIGHTFEYTTDMLSSNEVRSWVFRVVKWDGILPALIWTTPRFLRLIAPKLPGLVEITAIALPVIAFLVRYYFGLKFIQGNNCSRWMRRIQIVVFCLGIFVVVLFECVLILVLANPNPGGNFNDPDALIWLAIYAIYLAAMIFAMYPGRSKQVV
jgi:hypothetical protein